MGAPVFHWFLPSAGDGREVGSVTAVQQRSRSSIARSASIDYIAQVARAAEAAGFDAVLTPTGVGCEEPWLLCSALVPLTRRLQFIVAFRPAFVAPAWAAHQAATFQRLSGSRLLVNIVTGGDSVEQRALGDFLDHDQRYDRTDEFLTIFRRLWSESNLDFEGAHYRIEGGGLRLLAEPPPIYFGGASAAAERVAAEQADVYLTWGEPPALVAPRVQRMRELASGRGRHLRFGIRLHVISRDTAREAWREADRLLAGMDADSIAAAQARFARMDSVGQARMTNLHGGRRGRLEIAPNLWAGIGLVREGAATALVGSHEEVAERIEEYQALGFDEFIFSGYPHLEEAYRFGECVRPLFDAVEGPSDEDVLVEPVAAG
jgi:alkanesulfonate monooxygenase